MSLFDRYMTRNRWGWRGLEPHRSRSLQSSMTYAGTRASIGTMGCRRAMSSLFSRASRNACPTASDGEVGFDSAARSST